MKIGYEYMHIKLSLKFFFIYLKGKIVIQILSKIYNLIKKEVVKSVIIHNEGTINKMKMKEK